ncbi:MAG: VOC family protein [Rhodospirillales bacterium]|nr:VOC family protein [Rhodospirillales bacterium]
MHTPAFPEVGGVVHLEHVNFVVADHDLATTFFMGGLGFTRDPYKRADDSNMGVNVGNQQFHLPRRGATPSFPGEIGLVVPDLPGIKNRLARLQAMGRFAGTPFAVSDMGNTFHVISPFGIPLRLFAAGTTPSLRPLAISYVDVSIPVGYAKAVVAFYRDMMNCPAVRTVVDGEVTAFVPVGPYQSLRYHERDLDDYDTHNFHIAIYVTHYNEIREKLSQRDAFMGDGLNQTFFFKGVYEPSSGNQVCPLQHEIRGIYHPDFMRPLVNRWPMNSEPFSDQAAVMASLRDEKGVPFENR